MKPNRGLRTSVTMMDERHINPTPRGNGQASFLTHVIVVPADGVRRTGKARIRTRIPRAQMNPAFLTGCVAHEGWPADDLFSLMPPRSRALLAR